MNNYILLFLFSVFISSISQVILKKSALRKYDSKIKEYLNFNVIFAYALFFCCSFLSIYAYKKVPLSMGPVLEASAYIYIAVLSWFFFKEKLTIKKLFGNLLIIVGILIFTF